MFKKGYKQTEQQKKLIGLKNKGKIRSKEFRIERSKINKRDGIKPPSNLGKYFSEEHKLKLKNKLLGNKNGKNYKHTLEWKLENSKRNSGEKCNWWKGGITPENKLIRNSIKYSEWRLQVFGRDDFTCKNCGLRGVYLEAHHIKRFSEYPELRFDLNNGITLCRECHDLTKKKEVAVWQK